MFRLFLGLLLFFVVFRLLRRLARAVATSRSVPRQNVHRRRRRDPNPIDKATVIDVEYSETKEREGKGEP